MKQIATLAVAALLSLGNAMAVQYIDTNPANVRLDANPTVFGFQNPLYNPSHTGQWDLLNEGYNPANETITSATATFKLADLNGGSESYSITIDGDAFASGGNLANFQFTILSGVVGVDALLTLDSTGLLSYTVSAARGVFWLKEAKLVANATDRALPSPIGVPDGGATLALLGFGMLGLLGASRRIA